MDSQALGRFLKHEIKQKSGNSKMLEWSKQPTRNLKVTNSVKIKWAAEAES